MRETALIFLEKGKSNEASDVSEVEGVFPSLPFFFFLFFFSLRRYRREFDVTVSLKQSTSMFPARVCDRCVEIGMI